MTTNDALPDPYPVAQVKLTRGFSARPPGSKSLTNRALIMAALGGKEVRLVNPLTSEDTEVAKEALRTLGVRIDELEDGDWLVDGGALASPAETPTLFLGNAGTAMRFLTAALCARGIPCVLDGTARMRERPMLDLLDALRDLGGDVRSGLDNGCPPIVIGPGGLRGGETTMSGQVSSQFFSALMIAAPLARRDVVIHIKDELLSRPYVEMTAAMLQQNFQFELEVNRASIAVRAPQRYAGSQGLDIEADASAATYPVGLAVLHTLPQVKVGKFWPESIQGDLGFLSYLKNLGYESRVQGMDRICIRKTSERHGFSANLQEIPDAAMTLVTLLAVTPGHSSLTGLRNLAFKECDRLSALEAELNSLGCRVSANADGFEIDGVEPASLRATRPVRTYKDHRMAMCLAILGTVVPGGVEIEDPRCVEKTYPTFWADLAAWIARGTSG
jgi:3-phosphoshikimate 1-carboxyvinyltransferase